MSFSLKIARYRCFGDSAEGFDDILPVNVIIGRNNSGKSSLLDMVGFASNPTSDESKRSRATLTYAVPLREDMLGPFPKGHSGGDVGRHQDYHEYARQFLGRPVTWEVPLGGSDPKPRNIIAPDSRAKDNWAGIPLLQNAKPLENSRFFRLGAARDVVPAQIDYATDPGEWTEDGSSVTRTIAAFLKKQSLPKSAVTEILRTRLNEIAAPLSFTSIDTMMNEQNRWEVVLKEPGKKDDIPVSQSGAGLKTILCVLTLMELRPRLLDMNTPGGRHGLCYGLEELENNVHPTLLRRLLQYVRERALETDSKVFLTTHSPVAIDLFEGDSEAQIVHVSHDGRAASATRVDNYEGKSRILDDLGTKASDLLQSNCVVWVEGPSDRIYFNRWMDLWTNGELREGAHYQCMFYGGSLLYHVTASPDDNEQDADDPPKGDDDIHSSTDSDWANLLRLNRNAIVLFDHDGDSEDAELNPAKNRVLAELEEYGGLGWVTKGREVENYLPLELLTERADINRSKVSDTFACIPQILTKARKSSYATFFRRDGKVGLARDMCKVLTREHLKSHLDLAERLQEVEREIRKWNAMPPSVQA